MILTQIGTHTVLLDGLVALGNPLVSFTSHMPTDSCVCTTLRESEEEMSYIMPAASYLEQNGVEENKSDTVQKSIKILSNLPPEKQKKLKTTFAQNLINNVPGPKDGKDFQSFTCRRCQRNPATNTTRRTADRISKKRVKRLSKKNVISLQDRKRHKDKYGKDLKLKCNDIAKNDHSLV